MHCSTRSDSKLVFFLDVVVAVVCGWLSLPLQPRTESRRNLYTRTRRGEREPSVAAGVTGMVLDDDEPASLCGACELLRSASRGTDSGSQFWR